ncbi:hypothetical protein [Nocardioides sp. Soil805]|uniref:hypothetical protein n=1 Tax=Nocardioides sp. Soil805 TaxID=1736416 RepID=UPI00070383F4|nr:hypothetical protein [Nocardioides sp. Soil805]KRF36858.1 hypothetical protein ASG94_05520 [Nocardioides sp. Soil805]
MLLETARVVWPTARRIEVTRSRRPGPDERDYAVLPRTAGPRWLLPVDAPATGEALVGQESSRRRAAVRGLVAAHRAGLARRVPVRRLRVTSGHDNSLVALLEETFEPDADVAIRLGSWAHARNVVVRVLDREGTTVAFGKVGIDAHGLASVRAEGANLAHVAGLGLRLVEHSEVIARREWRGLDVLLVTPLVPGPAAADPAALPVEAMLELARSGGPRTTLLADSAWWTSVGARLDEVADMQLRVELQALARTLAVTSVPVPLGPWHGDWTAWNMAWSGRRVLLWDWEHFAEDVPVGFDLVHHLAQGLRVSSGTGPAAQAEWRSRSDDVLASHVGLDAPARDLVLAAYLLEVNLRYVLDRQGTTQAATPRAGWGLDLLRRETARLPATS